MRFQILGPVRVVADDRPLPLGGPKQRLVLALLIADAGRTVSTGKLIEGVWGDEPPETARKTLQGYVHHLRGVLGDAIKTEPSGYRLEAMPSSIDAAEFESLLARGRSLAGVDGRQAAAIIAEGLALWNGHPYEDLDGALALEPEISRLRELRMSAIEDRIEADLAAGPTGHLIGELESLTREFPLRERLRSLHMLALYQSGRQAEALRAYEKTRRYLAEELGLEPSPELRALQASILAQDPELLAEPPAADTPPRALHGYELREASGRGPIGTVHRAYQTSIGREVALKVIDAGVADEPSFIERFEEEAQRIGTLEHPHIVSLHDAWREPGAAYQVRAWLSGGNARHLVTAGQVSQAAAIQLLSEVGSAIAYAHRSGVVHCRLKPTNVLLDADRNAYVTDFAFAGTGAIAGSGDDEVYLAPELRAGAGPHLPGTDIYGLGALAHELLTGAVPGLDEGGGCVVAPGLPEAVGRELARALHPDPIARHGKVDDMLRGLRQAFGTDVSPAAATALIPRTEVRNPYKGLRAFQENDAGDFFGREDLIDRLFEEIDRRRFVALVGPSGIGKSSVVKAGLLPAKRSSLGAGDPPLLVTEMYPGSYPFEELEAALLRVAVERPPEMIGELTTDDRGLLRVSKQILPDDDSELLLIVDQFEELFSLVTDEPVRQLFLANLLTAVTDDRSRLRVVVTMRADFYDRPLEFHDFGRLFEEATVPVTVPSQDGLAQAVAAPARSVGLDLEPGLVAEIVRDVTGQPGALPLMQYALTELFEERESDVLTIDAYRATGGVLGALGRRAEELWQGLGPGGQEAIRQTFLRLVTVEEAADDVRRRVRRSELAALPVSQGELTAAINLFGAHRLLSFDRDPLTRTPTVEVAHEALLREWNRLRVWIDTQHEDLVVHRRLADALKEWDEAKREESYLLHGSRLAEFEAWARETTITLTSLEREFLEASRALRDADEARERRTSRRLRRMLVGVSLLAAVALVAGLLAFVQADRAGDEAAAAVASREDAETRRLALQAPQLVDSNRRVALLVAADAFRRDPGPVTLGALQQVLVDTGGFVGYRTSDEYRHLDFTAGGNVVALESNRVLVLDAAGGELIAEFPVTDAHQVSVAPDGHLAAIAEAAAVRLVDLSSGTSAELEPRAASRITAMAFDADGALLAVGDDAGSAEIYDVATGVLVAHIPGAHPERTTEGIEVAPHQPDTAQFGTRALAFSDDGSRLATGGLIHARVWDIETGRLIDTFELTRRRSDDTRFPAPVRAVDFSGAGSTRLIVASSFNVVTHDIGSGRLSMSTELEFPDRINAVSQNVVDAEVMLTDEHALLAQRGGRLVALPLDGESPPIQYDAQLSGDPRLALADDGVTVAVGGVEGVSIWSLDGRGLISISLPRDAASEVTFTSDGGWVTLSTPDERPVALYDLSGSTPARVQLPEQPPSDTGWLGAADGIFTWAFDDELLRFRPFDDLSSEGMVLGRILPASYEISPDGRLLAVSSGLLFSDRTVSVFDLSNGQLLAEPLDALLPADPESDSIAQSLSFSPDGSRLVGASSDGAAVIWDTATWEVAAVVSQGGGQVEIAEYSPDGKWLVTMSSDGSILLRDPQSLQPVGGPLLGQTDAVEGFTHGPTFTPDGRYMVTTADGVGRLWDLDARTQVGSAFPSDSGSSPGSSDHARWLGTFVGDQALIWDLDLAKWDEIACRAAGRNLTISEWEQFGPADESYRATCEMWPAAAAE